MTAHHGEALLGALEAVEDLADYTEARPLQYVRWTLPQLALLQSSATRAVLRTGNQFGKTWAGLAECIYRCLGAHPFKAVRPPPIEAWIMCTSWGQSLAVQEKLWRLLPKDALAPGVVYDPVNGFPGEEPVIRFANGSIIRIKTSGQKGLRLASATIHFILADEPLPNSRIYSELDRRLLRTGGAMYQTMTPINAPVDWVRELCEQGKITDLHFRMEAENFIPAGGSRPLSIDDGMGSMVPMDEGWIEGQRQSVMSWEAPVILDGEWEFRATGRVFEEYHSSRFRIVRLMHSGLMPAGELQLCLGLDYGEERLRTCAVLVAIDESGPWPRIFVLDEYVPETATTEDQDAEGIVAMLSRNGILWTELDHAHGDKKYTDASGYIVKKSNKTMEAEIEKLLRVRRGTLRPRLKGAKRGKGAGRGAVYAGIKFLHGAMIRPGHFYVDAGQCPWGDECLNKWDGSASSKYKDWIDALRYALVRYILRRRTAAARPQIRYQMG